MDRLSEKSRVAWITSDIESDTTANPPNNPPPHSSPPRCFRYIVCKSSTGRGTLHDLLLPAIRGHMPGWLGAGGSRLSACQIRPLAVE